MKYLRIVTSRSLRLNVVILEMAIVRDSRFLHFSSCTKAAAEVSPLQCTLTLRSFSASRAFP